MKMMSGRWPGALAGLFVLTFVFVMGVGLSAEVKRVAYFEVGPHWVFHEEYESFRRELLSGGRYEVEYPSELHVSAGWDKTPAELDEISLALHARDGIDLLVVAGTAAVRSALRTNRGVIPMIGVGLTDPLGGKLVLSADDSGADNFTCDVVEDRWNRMFRVFHEVVGFSKLGVLYSARVGGEVTSSLSDALRAGRELGFTVLARELPGGGEAECLEGLAWLYENGVDAFFLGSLPCFDWEQNDPSNLFLLLNEEYKLPTFARDGSHQVQGGALMGFSRGDFSIAGIRNARKAELIFGGAMPRSLSMRVEFAPLFVVNFQTALELEVDLPFDMLLAADEIYMETSKPLSRVGVSGEGQ